MRFLTGFPGFLGAALLPRLLARDGQDVACLVQPHLLPLAQQRIAALGAADRVRLCPGDLTAPDLGLGDVSWRAEVREVYHFAAVYDLGVGRDLGMRVNVEGTQHVLDFAARCPSLERLHYVSTCYVSGRYDGTFAETDLKVGQAFNNYYEETKYLAEVRVQEAMGGGLPVAIYRPAVVMGDSQTGATQKYDGIYYFVRWVLRQRGVAVVPMVGEPHRYTVNVVPSDFVTDAIDVLSATRAESRVYHLADPAPLTVADLVTAIGEATGRRLLRVPLPAGVATFALRHVPPVQALMQIPPDAVAYYVHPTQYATAATQAALKGTGVACPSLREYLPRLVDFVRAHPEVSTGAMV